MQKTDANVTEKASRRLYSLDALRGIAALMVCLCHFRHTLPLQIQDTVNAYGMLGVQIFFVISGFVIPFGMNRAGYQIQNFGAFMLKRLARLHPPYLVALLITLVLTYLSLVAKHEPTTNFFNPILKYLFYADAPSTNPVFWTLKVEMQYYLFIGLAYLAVTHKVIWIRSISLAGFLLCHLVAAQHLTLLTFMPYFLIGIATFLRFTEKSSWLEYGICLVACALASIRAEGIPEAVAALSTSLIIVGVNFPSYRVTDFMGAISYSLYLTHFVIGVKFINLLMPRVHGTLPQLGLLIATFLLCIGFAWLMFLIIEKPAMKWSAAVRYRRNNEENATSGILAASSTAPAPSQS